MSDVIVSVVESTTDVTVSEQSVAIAITEATTEVSASTVGLQGIPGATGATGATGASGVISVTAPITNTGSSSSAILGLDQTALSITRSQVSDFTSGTVASATSATSAGTASTAGTAFYSTTSGTSLTISGSITNSQVSDFASGTVANISGTVTQAQVTSLTTDLANRAVLNAANTFTVGAQTIQTGATANKGLVITGVASQAVNLQEWQSNAGTVAAINNGGGIATSNRLHIGSVVTVAGVKAQVTNATSTDVALVVKGAASQSANLQEWQDSAGATVASISSLGSFNNTTTGILTKFIRLGGAGYLGTLSLIAESASTIGVIVRGAASQSSNLQEWQNSGGTALVKIDNTGNLVASNNTGAINSGTFILGSRNSGGELTLVRASAATTNPGANLARIYFRDGTTTGTLKLVVRAGAAGAETTILDNIPQ